MTRSKDNRQGFTLIELMVVITIMVILAALAVGVGMYANTESMKKQTQATEAILLNAVLAYMELYPSSGSPISDTECFNTLYAIAMSTNPVLDAIRKQIHSLPSDVWPSSTNFRDAWGRQLIYSATGSMTGGPLFTSWGPDRTASRDDIRSDGMTATPQ